MVFDAGGDIDFCWAHESAQILGGCLENHVGKKVMSRKTIFCQEHFQKTSFILNSRFMFDHSFVTKCAETGKDLN